jgi:hypothetical protein
MWTNPKAWPNGVRVLKWSPGSVTVTTLVIKRPGFLYAGRELIDYCHGLANALKYIVMDLKMCKSF